MRVGADVQSTCRRCGDVWHVVIAMTNTRIAKVECKDCGARHGYRPVGAAARRKTASGTTRRVTAKRSKEIVAADLSRPPRSFATTETYDVGDRILHPSFGEGVVQSLIGSSKVEVLFEAGPKTMIHGRGSS